MAFPQALRGSCSPGIRIFARAAPPSGPLTRPLWRVSIPPASVTPLPASGRSKKAILLCSLSGAPASMRQPKLYSQDKLHFFVIIMYIAKSLQSCSTLCNPIDGNPLGFSVPGILQARILEWVAISFSNAWKWKVKLKSLSRVRPSATPWTAAYQAPLSMGFSRQEYWSGVSLPSPMYVYMCAFDYLINVYLFPTRLSVHGEKDYW